MDETSIEFDSGINELETSLKSGEVFTGSLFKVLCKKLRSAKITFALLMALTGVAVTHNVNAQPRDVAIKQAAYAAQDNIIKDINAARTHIQNREFDKASIIIDKLLRMNNSVKDPRLSRMVVLLKGLLDREIGSSYARTKNDIHRRVGSKTRSSMMEIKGKLIKVVHTTTDIRFSDKDRYVPEINLLKENAINQVIGKNQADKNKVIVSEKKDDNGFLEIYAWQKD